MPELATIATTVQIGKESTPGTGVAAGKLLRYTDFSLEPTVDTVAFKPMGTKINSTVLPGKDYTPLSINGQGSYSEIVYLLSSLLTDVTPSIVYLAFVFSVRFSGSYSQLRADTSTVDGVTSVSSDESR